ncbi:Spc97 / Spc98 family protein [Giardia muris]|uniref:Spc97 / Spc98 family protein n=1 Tax=Giardia muris TaxID=5742 RepID=A0A4Z1TDA4_GIAMU|nr:Spc97 / Spc98 family protein [Giardia muris]|eukprot:TNJ30511.1 Spc97 / Spc98 family protein [Giardia muris]
MNNPLPAAPAQTGRHDIESLLQAYNLTRQAKTPPATQKVASEMTPLTDLRPAPRANVDVSSILSTPTRSSRQPATNAQPTHRVESKTDHTAEKVSELLTKYTGRNPFSPKTDAPALPTQPSPLQVRAPPTHESTMPLKPPTEPPMQLETQTHKIVAPTSSQEQVKEAAISEAVAKVPAPYSKAGISFPTWFISVQAQSDLTSRNMLQPAQLKQIPLVDNVLIMEHMLVSDCIAVLQGCVAGTFVRINDENRTYDAEIKREYADKINQTLSLLTLRVLSNVSARFQLMNALRQFQLPESGQIANSLSHAIRHILKEYDYFLAQLSTQHVSFDSMGASKTRPLTLQKLEVRTRGVQNMLQQLADFTKETGNLRGCLLIRSLESAVIQSSGLDSNEVFIYLLSESLRPLGRILDQYITEAVIVEMDAVDFFIQRTESKEWANLFSINESSTPHFLSNIAPAICELGRSVSLLQWKRKEYGARDGTERKPLISPPQSGAKISAMVCGDDTNESLEISHIRLCKHIIETAEGVTRDILSLFLDQNYLNLHGHLRVIYAVYLVMSGDLLSSFVESTISDLEVPKGQVNILRIRNKFGHAIQTSSIATLPYISNINVDVCDKLFADHLAFVLNRYQAEIHEPDAGTKVLNLLGLKYNVEYPLTLVLSEGIMSRFNVIFRRLLRVKVIETELQKAWSTLKDLRRLERIPTQDGTPRKTVATEFGIGYQLLTKMLAFIHEIQFHYCSNIEDCILHYHEALLKAENLDMIISATGTCVESLLRCLGLSKKEVVKALDTALNDCVIYAHHIINNFCLLIGDDDEFIQRIQAMYADQRSKATLRHIQHNRREQALLNAERFSTAAQSISQNFASNRPMIQRLATKFDASVIEYETRMDELRNSVKLF